MPRRKLLIILAASALLCATAYPFTKAHLQALAILKQVGNQSIPWPAAATTEPITTQEIQLPNNIRARLYTPKNHPNAPSLIVLHGVHHLGMDEPRLESFAAAMSSCGLRVLTPELPGIKDYHVDASSIRVVGESARWFAAQTGAPVGVMGLSFSGGLALVAAADPAYRPAFKFVFAVGSQDSMDRVEQYYLTGKETRPDGTIELLPPHEYGALVLEYEHLEDFVPAADVEAIRPVLRQHLYEDKTAEAAATELLTPTQLAEVHQLIDTNSSITRARLAATESRHAQEMAGLSPQAHLKTLTIPVYLLHGQADNIIPAAETQWMATQLPTTSLQAALVSPVISHLDLEGAQPGAWDEWQIIHLMALVMHAAENK